jgi:hypothetical protein
MSVQMMKEAKCRSHPRTRRCRTLLVRAMLGTALELPWSWDQTSTHRTESTLR